MGVVLQDILEREEILLKPNDMNDLEKAKEISDIYMPDTGFTREDLHYAAMEMAQWKDEQLKHTRNEARDLYNEISACIGNLVKGRLDKNGIRESNALAQMESLMVKTEQFLLTI